MDFNEYNAVLGYYQVQSCLEFARGPAVLDLPCGDGLLTALFSDHFERIVGVDASSVHLARARERVPQGEFHEALIEELELDEKFDSVSMTLLLHCIPGGMQHKARVFDQVLPYVVPGGRIFGTTVLHEGVEHKSLAPMGEPAGPDMVGLLQRRPVRSKPSKTMLIGCRPPGDFGTGVRTIRVWMAGPATVSDHS